MHINTSCPGCFKPLATCRETEDCKTINKLMSQIDDCRLEIMQLSDAYSHNQPADAKAEDGIRGIYLKFKAVMDQVAAQKATIRAHRGADQAIIDGYQGKEDLDFSLDEIRLIHPKKRIQILVKILKKAEEEKKKLLH